MSETESQMQAHLLSQALPYMQRYENRTIVVKYGGHAMGDATLGRAFARDIALLKQSGVNPIVVHGGGPQIGAMLTKMGIESKFEGGLRVTDEKTVEIVEMVLAGSINKEIVAMINAEGEWAIGLCGKDGNMVFAEKAKKKITDPESNIERILDLGFVGEVVEVDRTLIDLLAKSEMIPVIAPVAPGRDGHTYNINADTFAGAVAGALNATRLLFLTDVPGVLGQGREPYQGTVRRGCPPADRRRHDLGRDDPQGADLHRRDRGGRRGRRHPQRQDPACRAPRNFHGARGGHADRRLRPSVNRPDATAAGAGTLDVLQNEIGAHVADARDAQQPERDEIGKVADMRQHDLQHEIVVARQ